jgi:RecA/RadA recombinase
LNLCFSGRTDGGWGEGSIGHVVGDSDTGKTMLVLHSLAEASIHKPKKVLKIFDDAAASSSDGLLSMFSTTTDSWLMPPPSKYIDDFFGAVHNRVKAKVPFIYALDDMDVLQTHAGVELFEENQKLLAAGKEKKGSYGMGKAKTNSDALGMIKQDIKELESLLLIISQTRDNINPMTMAEKTHAGGRALKFYAAYQLWLALRGAITMSRRGVKYKIGIIARVKVTKNHVTGSYVDFQMPIYYGYGIDDFRCSMQWMADNKLWEMKEGKLRTGKYGYGLKADYDLNDFIKGLRAGQGVDDFQSAIQQGWDLVESECRQPGRYSGQSFSADDCDFSFE